MAVAAATILAGAAQATSPSLVSDLPCFSPLTGSRIVGTGWTPGGQVRLSGRYVSRPRGPALDETVTSDSEGRIDFRSDVPNDVALRRRVELTAEDLTRAGQGVPDSQRLATTRFTLSWYGPFYRPWNRRGGAPGRPGRVAMLRASGYIEDDGSRVLYAHYVLGGERVWTVRVGRLSGPCGALRARFREFGFHPVPRGAYSVYFDTVPFFTDDNFASPRYKRVVVR